MGLVKPDINSFAKIKVLGIGGGGGNAVNTMIREGNIKGVEFIAVNTDLQAMLSNNAETKLQIGEELTQGLGSGGDPEIGTHAAEESRDKIRDLLVDTDMTFLTAGMGGGTGTGAAPIIAEISREVGALTVAVVTKPFVFEGTRRMVQAEEGIEQLKDKVDTLIVIPNQKVMEIIDEEVSMLEAFSIVDSVLSKGVQAISDLITVPGLINVDFADVRAIMYNAGSALMGTGTGSGDNRAQEAARDATNSPLLETSIEGARGILFNITGGPDLTMTEVNNAAQIIAEAADADANIIFGANIDESLKKGDMKISVIATGFDESRRRLQSFVSRSSQSSFSAQRPTASAPSEQPTKSSPPQDNQKPVKEDKEPQKKESQEETKDKTSKDIDDKYKHSEVEVESELDIPAFLRKK